MIEKESQVNELKAKITEVEEAIKIAESFDLPLEKLYEQEKDLKASLEGLEEPDKKLEEEGGNQDAPFCRVLMLVEVNKDDLEIAANTLRNCIPRGLNIRYFEAL